MAESAGAAELEDPPTGRSGLLATPQAKACPYLVAAAGGWRTSVPSRDHRCTALAPAATLARDKQRRLCLTPTHTACATYVAALDARRERGLAPDGPSPVRWEVARTTAVVDAGLGLGTAVRNLVAERRGWQAVPAFVLLAALAAVALSGLGRDQPGGAVLPSPSASRESFPTISTPPTAQPSASAPIAATPSPSAPPTPSPSVPATPPPTSTPAPSARTTYTVKTGDTLYDIAIAFGTSVAAIKELNGLTSNTIHAGLVLLIP